MTTNRDSYTVIFKDDFTYGELAEVDREIVSKEVALKWASKESRQVLPGGAFLEIVNGWDEEVRINEDFTDFETLEVYCDVCGVHYHRDDECLFH
jgi:hypothetical protein